MKKLMTLTAATLVLSASAAMAGHGGHKGKMFEKMDLNNDAMVTKSEFMTSAEQRFDKMDADNDGNITKEEVEAMKEKWHAEKKDYMHKDENAAE